MNEYETEQYKPAVEISEPQPVNDENFRILEDFFKRQSEYKNSYPKGLNSRSYMRALDHSLSAGQAMKVASLARRKEI